MYLVYIEILSVTKKRETDKVEPQSDALREQLDKYGYRLTGVKKTLLQSTLVNAALNSIASSEEKPDVVIITNALNTRDSRSFKKYFVETVAAAECAVNKPAPKGYWKDRRNAILKAKKEGADKERIKQLESELDLERKKAKVFSLGDFGNGYKGYCFIYKGVRVAALPKAELTGAPLSELVSLAAVRTSEVFENAAKDYPDGYGLQRYTPPKTGFANQYIPMRGDDAKELFRKFIVIAAFLVFLAAVGLLFYNMVFLSVRNSQLNGEIQTIAHRTSREDSDLAPDKGKDKKDDSIDWDALKKINKEIVGWIQVKNTHIDYPVLWHKGDSLSGQYYLNHNYRGEYDSYGTVFVDYRCTKGTDSKNLVLHAHHMNDGSMFGDLMNYGGTTGNLDFYKKSPTIRFDTPSGDGVWKIISVYKTNTLSSQGEFFNYLVGNFQNDKDFLNYVYNVRIRSLIDCPVDVNEDDELLTLSTCSYEYTNFRTVIVARRTRIGESPKVDVKKAKLASNPVWPQVYYSNTGGTRPTVTDFDTAYNNGEIKWYDGEYNKVKDIKVTQPTTAPPSTNAQGQPVTAVPTTELRIFHTVKFINYDGSLIEEQKVEDAKAARAPADPVKPSDDYYDYYFKGWGLDFNCVVTDMTVAPVFEAVLKPEYQQQGG